MISRVVDEGKRNVHVGCRFLMTELIPIASESNCITVAAPLNFSLA